MQRPSVSGVLSHISVIPLPRLRDRSRRGGRKTVRARGQGGQSKTVSSRYDRSAVLMNWEQLCPSASPLSDPSSQHSDMEWGGAHEPHPNRSIYRVWWLLGKERHVLRACCLVGWPHPVDGPTPTGIWSAQIGLGGLFLKRGHEMEKG